MRLGIISDLHADIGALRDALARLAGCETIVCCGDIVDEGSEPEAVIAALRAAGVLCIRGNHDRWVAERGTHRGAVGDELPLAPGTLAWLEALPPGRELLVGEVRVAVAHGSPRSDMRGIEPEDTELRAAEQLLEQAGGAEVLIVGHTHRPFELALPGGRMIVNPGALLRETPGQGAVPAAGTYGVLELPARRFEVYRASDGERVDITRASRA